MTRRDRFVARLVLLLALLLIGVGSLGGGRTAPVEAAPLAAVSLGLIPGSGPAGMTITAVGSGWTFANSPYAIFWEFKGGTQLGTFGPDGAGSWSMSITIPGGATAGAHNVVACEGYTTEFEQCATQAFTVIPPTATVTPTRTRTPTPLPGSAPPVTWTPTRTPTRTPLSGCRDEVTLVSPINFSDLGGVSSADLVIDVILTDPATGVLQIYEGNLRSSPIYTQWPDPNAGTSVEASPDPVDPGRIRVTVHDYPLHLGYNQFGVTVVPTCGYADAYYQLSNGTPPTATPRPDSCGGLGLPADATVVTFSGLGTASGLEQLTRESGVRFENSMRAIDPSPILPRSGSVAGASVEGLEFGSTMLPIRMAFDRPLTALGVFVGFPEPQYVTTDVTAILTAYGYHAGSSELELLGSDSTSFPAAPTDIIHCLHFTAAEGDIIARALVEYTDATGNSLAERRLIDDLTIVYAEEDLPPDRPPVIEITSPADGGSIPGTTVNLRASIREDRQLDRVAFQIDGGPETALGAAPSLTDPAAYYTGANFSAAIVAPGVSHLLTVTAYDSAGQFAEDTVRFIVPTPVPTIDLQAVKMEVVQVIQCLDNPRCADNAVPMVVDKPTWVRLYVRAEGGPPARPVSGRLCRGRVATCDSGMVLPLNRISPDDDDDPSVNDRGNLDASLNFIVPPVWLADGTLEMTAFVNYNEEDMDEVRDDNNTVQAAVPVQRARALTVMFMPVTADGHTAPISEMWPLVERLSRLFPVSRVTAVARGALPGNFDLSDSSGGNCGRTWNRLMDALRGAYLWRGPGSASLYGMVPQEANTDGVGGCGEVPGRVASGIVIPGWAEEVRIAAQELGHTFGRNHATACGRAGNPDGNYPRRGGLLDDWGFDVAARHLYPMNASHDYMSYCATADDHWTSAYTYLALLGTLPLASEDSSGARLAAPYVADGQPLLIGGGQISPDGFTLERGFYRAALAEGIEDNLPDGPYTAMLLDSAGAGLYARTFNVISLSNAEPGETGYFQIFLPDIAETAAIVFLYDGKEIGRVAASANIPQVSIVEPLGGEDWGASGAHTIAWQASDADGDALRFNVLFSTDGGVSWEATGVDLTDTSVSIDSADLPGGNMLFRVLASDGLNTAENATTAPVTIGDKAPLMHLASPVDGDWLPAGEAVVFRGYATDLEDVVLDDAAYRWTSDVDGDLGSGPMLWGLPLSVGAHRITLTVTDRAGNTVSESVSITIGGAAEAEPAQPSTLALVMAGAGLLLLVGAGAGVLIYALRSRPARR